jgi:hypothetical protein
VTGTLRAVALTIAFLLELALLAAVGWWGFSLGGLTGWLAGLGGPILVAVLWGRYAAPKAPHPLRGPAGVAFRLGCFACGTAALVLAGHPSWGVALAAGYLLNSACLLALDR